MSSLPSAASTMRAALEAISVSKWRRFMTRVSTNWASGKRRGDAEDRLVGEEERALRHGMDVAGEAERRRDNRAGAA